MGRARYQGEVTQGKLSLQFMNENPKTLFYHRKALLSKGLMLKQVHHQKTKGQNFQGTLFHIPRFETLSLKINLIWNIFLDYDPEDVKSYVSHTLRHQRMWVDARVCGIRLKEVQLAMAMATGNSSFFLQLKVLH